VSGCLAAAVAGGSRPVRAANAAIARAWGERRVMLAGPVASTSDETAIPARAGTREREFFRVRDRSLRRQAGEGVR